MSWKKIVQGVVAGAGIVLAPVTGGASLALTAGALGSAASDNAQNKAQKEAERLQEEAIKAQEKLLADQVQAQKDLTAESAKINQGTGAITPAPTVIIQPATDQGTNKDVMLSQQVQQQPNYLLIAAIAGVTVLGLYFIAKQKGK